jgi:hypothetical protein
MHFTKAIIVAFLGSMALAIPVINTDLTTGDS